jgi:thiamine-phosphate pyrophosphorylase
MNKFHHCLYFVTPDIENDLSAWQQIVLKAIEGGIGMVQLRGKCNDTTTIIKAARGIQPFLKRARIPLIINDNVEIAYAVGADGIHVGQSDSTIAHARSILGKNAIIGLSVENMEQAIAAEQQEVSYLSASPVFPTSTKKNCQAPWGLLNLQELCQKSRFPIFAIGGIDLQNISSVIDCGVCGVAVVSAIASAPCPKEATTALLLKMRG